MITLKRVVFVGLSVGKSTGLSRVVEGGGPRKITLASSENRFSSNPSRNSTISYELFRKDSTANAKGTNS